MGKRNESANVAAIVNTGDTGGSTGGSAGENREPIGNDSGAIGGRNGDGDGDGDGDKKRGRGRPAGSGKRGSGNNRGKASAKPREEATVRPSQRNNGGKSEGKRGGSSGNKKNSNHYPLAEALEKWSKELFSVIGAPEMAFSKRESEELAEKWKPFQEHWIPSFDGMGIHPKWPALFFMLIVTYKTGHSRMELLKELRAKRRGERASPAGDGPVVDGTAEPVGEYHANGVAPDIFAPLNDG